MPRFLMLSTAVPVLLSLVGCLEHGMSEPSPIVIDGEYAEPIAPEEDESGTNPWVETAMQGVSTFSADVDSGSYTLARRALVEGTPVDPSSIRTEEFLNYFQYATPGPVDDLPFGVSLEVGPSAFGPDADTKLLRIGVQAEEIPEDQRAPVNLVFLIDVSGSMANSDKLGLVKYALGHLVDRLSPSDTLGIVVYAGNEGVVLEPTAVEDKSAILEALDSLTAGGSTNGQAGIEAAYDLAETAFRTDGVNRVVLCSDGDMNVGLTGNALAELVGEQRDRGIFLTTLGVGTGNYQDTTMESLAQEGNGNYAYIDTPNEALRVLGENLVSTLQVVAKDTKFQVTFDAAVVERWRLIGYENRLLDEQDFADDTVDAGDIGAGHHVTALYELDLVDGAAGTLVDLGIRYKEPTSVESTLHTWTVDVGDQILELGDTSDDFRFATATAEFAEILRESPHSTGDDYAAVRTLVEEARPATTRTPMQAELLELIDLAAAR